MNDVEESLTKIDFEFLTSLKKAVDKEFQDRLNKNYKELKWNIQQLNTTFVLVSKPLFRNTNHLFFPVQSRLEI